MSLTTDRTSATSDESGLKAIMDMATAYWTSMVLLASNSLDIFTALASGPQSAEELAFKGYGHERTLSLLLNACVAGRLIEREGSTYRNSPSAQKYLVKGNPAYIGNALKYAEDMYGVWGKLAETVRTNQAAIPPANLLGAEAGRTRNFVLAMHNRALGVASALAHVLDLSGRRWLLVNDARKTADVKRLLENTPGIEQALDGDGKQAFGLDHPRSGELVAIAQPDKCFTYYYWLDDSVAPDFARTVDIHRKPGYDPVDLFIDPKILAPKLKVARILLKKWLGFRYLMDVIPLDASLVQGSHGRLADDLQDCPVFLSNAKHVVTGDCVKAASVKDLVLQHIFDK